MMTAAFIVIGAMLAAGLLAELITVIAAPLGFQDKSGFHTGERSESKEPAQPSAKAG